MDRVTSLAELQRSGLTLTADEAVAIVRKIIRERDEDRPAQPPFGPPALDNVLVAEDGTVECCGCETTPTAAEMAILLQAMLAGAPHVPGGLRYTMARAVHDVDAPPFDSVNDFSAALARYEPPDPDDAVRRVVARWLATAGGCAPDRRRAARSPDDLRRHLREADRRLYESQAERAAPPDAPPWRLGRWAAGALVAGALTTGAVAAFGDGHPPLPPAPESPSIFAPGELAGPPRPMPPFEGRKARAADAPTMQPATPQTRAHPKHPVHEVRVRAPREREHRRVRLRWLHKAFAFRDDLS